VAKSRLPIARGTAAIATVALLAVSASSLADAQATAGGSAAISIGAVVRIRSVSAPATRQLDATHFEVTQQVTTAANVNYDMNVVAEEAVDGSIATVRSLDGTFVPVSVGASIAAARGARGSESVTIVTFRINAPNGIGAALGHIALQAVAESPSGAVVVSAPVLSTSGTATSVAEAY
jgi:hypothetical protein